MIELPKGAFMVIQDDTPEKTDLTKIKGLITEEMMKDPKRPNTGEITFTSKELKHYQGLDVCFRESFGEEIEIEGTIFLFFRDFNSSIYYVLTNEH